MVLGYRMKAHRFCFLACSLLLAFFNCATTSPLKQRLENAGYAFHLEDFFKAIDNNDFSVVAIFIEAGFNLNLQEKETKITGLNRSLYNGNIPIAKLLISKGASPLLADEIDGLPLDIALFKSQWNPQYFQIAEMLIYEGSPVNISNKNGESALILAVKAGQLQLVKLMIEKGADKNRKDREGKTALDWANELQHSEVSALLR
ncbi:MAG: ankyrin repeat domain-containing protein [Chitinispirillaceae bacterium]|nr:ankyrin repeat domain-containing protein [Chitinispirillaceae bacterium]